MEFVAKPQLTNRRYTETFDNLKDAVDYLNEFNNLGDEEGGLPRLRQRTSPLSVSCRPLQGSTTARTNCSRWVRSNEVV